MHLPPSTCHPVANRNLRCTRHSPRISGLILALSHCSVIKQTAKFGLVSVWRPAINRKQFESTRRIPPLVENDPRPKLLFGYFKTGRPVLSIFSSLLISKIAIETFFKLKKGQRTKSNSQKSIQFQKMLNSEFSELREYCSVAASDCFRLWTGKIRVRLIRTRHWRARALNKVRIWVLNRGIFRIKRNLGCEN